MIRFKLLILILILSFNFSYSQDRKVVFIILDGIPADVLENVETPVLDEISSGGGYTHAYVGGEQGGYSESPTVSAVGYNHLLTGVWSNKHNVYGNGIKDPKYAYWNIFRVVENHDSSIKTAIFSTWLDNRTKLIGEGKPEAGNISLDYSFDGFEHDTETFPHDKERLFIFNIDEHVSKEAGRYIQEEGPDLSWVYLEYTDDIGHKFGDGTEMIDAVKKADRQVGRVWDAIRKREENLNEKWMIVITTDHGRDAKTGKNHGGHSERERNTWIVTNVRPLNDRFRQNPGIVDIMPSMLRFMEIEMPERIMEENDGIPFIGEVSIANLFAEKKGDEILLSWDVINPDGSAEFFIAETNDFRDGKEDEYRLAGSADVKTGKMLLDVKNYSSDFYKILVKAPYNWTNRWVME